MVAEEEDNEVGNERILTLAARVFVGQRDPESTIGSVLMGLTEKHSEEGTEERKLAKEGSGDNIEQRNALGTISGYSTNISASSSTMTIAIPTISDSKSEWMGTGKDDIEALNQPRPPKIPRTDPRLVTVEGEGTIQDTQLVNEGEDSSRGSLQVEPPPTLPTLYEKMNGEEKYREDQLWEEANNPTAKYPNSVPEQS